MKDPAYGPLPTLLGILTLLTGFIDAVTYLKYGHVFVANMTIAGTLLAMGGFLAGALAGGLLNERLSAHRGNLLSASTAAKTALLLCATLAAAVGAEWFVVIPLLGITMGIQNAVVRRLAIPDVTTTVLTMTLTGIMADSALVGGKNPRLGRRVAAVVTMFAGALGGASCVLYVGIPFTLGMATFIVAAVGVATYACSRGTPAWVT